MMKYMKSGHSIHQILPLNKTKFQRTRYLTTVVRPTLTLKCVHGIQSNEIQQILLVNFIAKQYSNTKIVTVIHDVNLMLHAASQVEQVPLQSMQTAAYTQIRHMLTDIGTKDSQVVRHEEFITSQMQDLFKEAFVRLRTSSDVYKGQLFGFLLPWKDELIRQTPPDLAELIFPNQRDKSLFLTSTLEPVQEIKGFSIWYFRYSRHVAKLHKLLAEKPSSFQPATFHKSLLSHVSTIKADSSIDIPISLPRSDYPFGAVVPQDMTSSLHGTFVKALVLPLMETPDLQIVTGSIPMIAFQLALFIALNKPIPTVYFVPEHTVKEQSQKEFNVTDDAFRYWALTNLNGQDLVSEAEMRKNFHQDIIQPLRRISRFTAGLTGQETNDTIDIVANVEMHVMQFRQELFHLELDCLQHPILALRELEHFTRYPGTNLSQARAFAAKSLRLVLQMLQDVVPTTCEHFKVHSIHSQT
jgi:hypothetical protein